MKILIGVTGGIAAYKVADLASVLANGKTGTEHEVKIIMTENAKKIITPLTLATMSKNEVYDDAIEWQESGAVVHIELAKWADMFVVVPATANTITKLALGITDNLLTSVYLALPEHIRVVICPAMNTRMWEKMHIQRNLMDLRSRPLHTIIDPEVGLLACGDTGIGKLPSVKKIAEVICGMEL
jgi:phosphopantothenoylcysteine decarboxylase/phosphopantothenate--cysteine ligase